MTGLDSAVYAAALAGDVGAQRRVKREVAEQLSVMPTPTHEYGARDPDNHDKIHAHKNLEMARDAADWWRIDGKVYIRAVTDWEVLDD